ncbi:MAG: hypothetical protein ABUL72_05225 [Armatimonadota bacterium]
MLTPIIVAILLHPQSSEVVTPKEGSPVRKAVLDALRAKTKSSLKGKKVLFKVDHMKQKGDWVFFKGKGQNPAGGDLDYHGTTFQEDIDNGAFDDWCCGLFHRVSGKWKVVEWSWGGTDVSYWGWWDKHHAPRDIFPPEN